MAPVARDGDRFPVPEMEEGPVTNSPKHAEIRHRIEAIGIIPSIRTRSADGARFAAETVAEAGIPVVEITMTVPDALRIVADLRRRMPDMIVGADSEWDLDSARRAVDAGAMFVTSPGLDSRSILEFVIQEDLVVIPGALTPSELSSAWQAGADFVKVFPCHSMGGPRYIRALHAPFPAIPIVASGGVNQVNAHDFITGGAVALGIGTELIPRDAVESRNRGWIAELARRFLRIVKEARASAEPFEQIPDRK
jgi:2-dehydro-3-deoxyphosphogluconate aldolase/(4S)-4-hydroxy-2-oxoglutarate aldolase